MPIYEYECKNCNKRFEKLQSITADPLTECINCGGGPIRRVLHPVGVIFKGSGWYVTDSRRPAASESSSSSTGDKADKGTSTDKGKSDGDGGGKSSGDSTAKSDTSSM